MFSWLKRKKTVTESPANAKIQIFLFGLGTDIPLIAIVIPISADRWKDLQSILIPYYDKINPYQAKSVNKNIAFWCQPETIEDLKLFLNVINFHTGIEITPFKEKWLQKFFDEIRPK